MPFLPALQSAYALAIAPLLSGTALMEGFQIEWWMAGLIVLVGLFLLQKVGSFLIKIGGLVGVYVLLGGDLSTLGVYAGQAIEMIQSTFNIDVSEAIAFVRKVVTDVTAGLTGS